MAPNGTKWHLMKVPSRFDSPPASRGWPWVGGARLTRRNGRPRERNPCPQRHLCPSRYNSIRKPLSSHAGSLAFEGELFAAASLLRVSVQQFRVVCCPAVLEPPPRPS